MNSAPSTDASSSAQESSSSALQDSENRGVTAYRDRRTPCQRSASARPSASARSGVVSSAPGSSRSLTTSPEVTRSPTRSASVNSASTAGAKCEPNTSADVVPARARPSTNSAATVRA